MINRPSLTLKLPYTGYHGNSCPCASYHVSVWADCVSRIAFILSLLCTLCVIIRWFKGDEFCKMRCIKEECTYVVNTFHQSSNKAVADGWAVGLRKKLIKSDSYR